MALSDVQELSSLLRTEDLEKSELNRKKLSIDLAIKQQEGRLFYECEERDRCLRGISLIHEKLCDSSSTFELKEIEVQELASEIRKQGMASNLNAQFNQFLKDKSKFSLSINNIAETVDRAIQMIEKLETNPYVGILKRKLDAEFTIKHLEEEIITLTCSAESSMKSVTNKEEELVKLDIEAADICGGIDSTEQLMCSLDATLMRKHEEVERLKSVVSARKIESAQADFRFSAELGKKAEMITSQRDKIAEETKTAAALEKESTQLTQVVEIALTHVQRLNQQQAETKQLLEQTQRDFSNLQTRKMSLHQAHDRLLSELAAANHLCQTVALQSFKSRADDLAEELREIDADNERAEAQLRFLEEQLADNMQHAVLRDLKEHLISVEQDQTTSRERRGLLRQELEMRQQAYPSLCAEKLTLQTCLADDEAVCEQVATHVQMLRDQVQALRAEQASRTSLSETQERIATMENEHVRAAADQMQHKAQTREVQAHIEQRTKELASLQHAVQERSQAAIATALSKDKQKRVAVAKENMINQHRQAVVKLRKLLMDEDKHFQLTQQQERAEHDAAMSELVQEKRTVDAELAQRQEELTQLQQELAEEAPLLPESPLLASALADANVNPTFMKNTTTLQCDGTGSAPRPVLQPAPLSQPHSSQPIETKHGQQDSTGNTASKRAKHTHSTAAPAAVFEGAQGAPAAQQAGKKTTKKKRKV